MSIESSYMFTGSTENDPIVFSHGNQFMKARKDSFVHYCFYDNNRLIFMKTIGTIDYFFPYAEHSGLFDLYMLPNHAAQFINVISKKYPKLVEWILFNSEEFFR